MQDKFKTWEFGGFFGDVGCSVPPGNLPLLTSHGCELCLNIAS